MDDNVSKTRMSIAAQVQRERTRLSQYSDKELIVRYLGSKQKALKALYLAEIRRRDKAIPDDESPFRGILHRRPSGLYSTRNALSGRFVTGKNPKRPKKPRTVTHRVTPASVYIGTDDPVVAFEVYRELSRLFNDLGLDHEIEDVRPGSIWLSFRAWLRKGETKEELRRKLAEATASAEMYGYAVARRAPAEVDSINAGTIGSLIAASQDADLCIMLEQVYVLKGHRPDGTPFCVAGQFSPSEAKYVKKNPQLKSNPYALLQYLEDGVALEGLLDQPSIDAEAVEGEIVDPPIEGDQEDPDKIAG